MGKISSEFLVLFDIGCEVIFAKIRRDALSRTEILHNYRVIFGALLLSICNNRSARGARATFCADVNWLKNRSTKA